MCQRRNSKCKLASNLERGGSAGTSQVTSNICRSNVEESEAREVHREAHFNPVWGGRGVEGVPAAALSSK